MPFSAKDDGVDLSLGIGADHFFTKSVGARVEWEHFELDPGKASLLSAGVVVKFWAFRHAKALHSSSPGAAGRREN